MGDSRGRRRGSTLKVDTENVPDEDPSRDALVKSAPAASMPREGVGDDVRKVSRVISAPVATGSSDLASPQSAPVARTSSLRSIKPRSSKNNSASRETPKAASGDGPADDGAKEPTDNSRADPDSSDKSAREDSGSSPTSGGKPSPGRGSGESAGGNLKKSRRASSEPDLQELNGKVERPKLKHASSDLEPKTRERTPKIQWNNRVQVESLMVPTCPVHGQKFMEFKKGTSKTAAAVEFADLVDWVKESRALGARCTCKKCDPPKNLGNIEKSQDAVIEKSSGADGGLRDWSCFGCEISVLSSW